jgi:hypothetical protein
MPLTAVAVAAQATLLQAKYGCTVFGCRQGYECDKKTHLCKARREAPGLPSPTEPPPASDTCVGSADGLITLCVSTDSAGTFQIHAQNSGTSAVVLSLRELTAKSTHICPRAESTLASSPSAEAQPEPPIAKPRGLRFLSTSNTAPLEPRSALFLSPGPPTDLEVVFEMEGASECALDLTATFAVAHCELRVVARVPPSTAH